MCYYYSSTFYLNMFLAVLGVDLLQFLRFVSVLNTKYLSYKLSDYVKEEKVLVKFDIFIN